MHAFQPRLAGRGERRIERAEALADDADAMAVHVVARLKDVDHRADDAAPLVRDRQTKRGFALARTVERQRRKAAGDESLGPGVQLLLAGIEARQDDGHGRAFGAARLAQPSRHERALIRKLDALDRRVEHRRGRAVAAQHGVVRAAEFIRAVGEQVLAVVIVDRRADVGLRRGEAKARGQRLIGELSRGARPRPTTGRTTPTIGRCAA